jgi:hypothetical protein
VAILAITGVAVAVLAFMSLAGVVLSFVDAMCKPVKINEVYSIYCLKLIRQDLCSQFLDEKHDGSNLLARTGEKCPVFPKELCLLKGEIHAMLDTHIPCCL